MAQSNHPKSEFQNLTSKLLWILAAVYVYALLLSPPGQLLPGEPVWNIQPETLQEIWHESINFFFILPIVNILGWANMPAPVSHPWLESLFNLAEAWMLMFLPLMLADARGRNLPKLLIWGLAMFLTNTFLIPYMAIRATNSPIEAEEKRNPGLLKRGFGWLGLIVSIIAIIWAFLARPEFGDLTQRANYFLQQLMSDRLTIAFCVDLVLFAVFQAMLIGDIEPPTSKKRRLRFIPFWGLVLWLVI
ncbi:hypothetical protein Nos7524_1142 [Nostoc sp. PCC 7524]|uniref:hypothetical protein n=1 Tax=Nostoc sp. (strain ATCC 29411 / PCC 7524) TaxID=28072 RepID=UPI00029EEDAB|nr:hypothetical protein [Nostoc sp. PCC 7524]AFY47034.1 hypothetical protein Nos7524_1142 [Nostoc sp. PCC 7524]